MALAVSQDRVEKRGESAGPSLPQMHKDLVTSERGGPSPYRAVEHGYYYYYYYYIQEDDTHRRAWRGIAHRRF
jgi:hypothetical protein